MKLDLMLLLAFLLGATCGIIEAPDVNFNRLRTLDHKHTEESGLQRHSSELRRGKTKSYDSNNIKHRAGMARLNQRHVDDVKTLPNGDIEKVYSPKEDPRDYYQSESYLRYALARNDIAKLREMSSVYPELEPRLASMRIKTQRRNLHESSPYREWNSVSDYVEDLCLKCPSDRTLVIRPGVDKVLLQPPHLKGCSGQNPPRGVRFVRSHGPVFGSLVGAGSHVIFGRIIYKGQYLQSCRYVVHVASRLCPVPRDLSPLCDGIRCNFTCADPALEMFGSASLMCGDDLRWSGALPVCRGRTWCQLTPPPSDGELSCQSMPGDVGARVSEGSRCRARCRRGWRAEPRGSAACRRGAWTVALACKRHRPRISRIGERK